MFCPKFKRITVRYWLRLKAYGKRMQVARRAKKEMVQVQKTDKILFSVKAHAQLCREILQYQRVAFRISKKAQHALAESSQELITSLFQDCQEAAEHSGRVTIMPKDMQYVVRQWKKADGRVEAAH